MVGDTLAYRFRAYLDIPVTGEARPHGRWGLIASGAFPCPGAAAIMLFSVATGSLVPGIMAVIAMSLGMASDL